MCGDVLIIGRELGRYEWLLIYGVFCSVLFSGNRLLVCCFICLINDGLGGVLWD